MFLVKIRKYALQNLVTFIFDFKRLSFLLKITALRDVRGLFLQLTVLLNFALKCLVKLVLNSLGYFVLSHIQKSTKCAVLNVLNAPKVWGVGVDFHQKQTKKLG